MLDQNLCNELGVWKALSQILINAEQLKEWEEQGRIATGYRKTAKWRNSKSKLIGEAKSQGKDVSAILTTWRI